MASTPWPLPMSHQDVALRQRCARLLQALQRIGGEARALIGSNVSKAWQVKEELETFSMLAKGSQEISEEGLLEAPIYSNSQIEAAWLFLFEVRRRHFNRRKQIQECTKVLGASHNWSMLLFGSKRIHQALRGMPPDARLEILEDASAMDLLAILQKQPMPSQPSDPQPGDWPSEAWPQEQARWPSESEARPRNPFKDREDVPAIPMGVPLASSNPFRKREEPEEKSKGDVFGFDTELSRNAQPGVTAQAPEGVRLTQQSGATPQQALEGVRFAQQSGVTPQQAVEGVRLAQQSGVTPQQALDGARMANQAGVTPQHALEGARMAHQAGVRPQHLVQGAQMAHQAGLRPQHFVEGAKAVARSQVSAIGLPLVR